jgi:hypothetical protein
MSSYKNPYTGKSIKKGGSTDQLIQKIQALNLPFNEQKSLYAQASKNSQILDWGVSPNSPPHTQTHRRGGYVGLPKTNPGSSRTDRLYSSRPK